MKLRCLYICCLALLAASSPAAGEVCDSIEPIPFGDMEQWVTRYISESRLLGGQTKKIYVLAPTDTIRANTAYDYSNTVWGISNAYANVSGIAKAACTTQPDYRDDGTLCARLDTKIETVCVLGIIDIQVCIAGTLFLGAVNEPVRSTNDPYGAIDMGIPFDRCPKAVMLDIKARVNPERKVVKALGFGRSVIDGHDEPEVYVYLQRRWEDEQGNIFAERVGTMRKRFDVSIPEWQNDCRLDIHYGDITNDACFKPYMGLFPAGGQFKARNSKGKMMKITEVGYAKPGTRPTHVILMITAGCYPAFYGAPGNAIWVDNVRWVF